MDNFPEIKLFPVVARLERAARFVGRLFLQMPHEPYIPEVPHDPFITEMRTWEQENGIYWDG